ncbi:MAG TPA: hypothetical protein VMS21_11965 [Methylomirabilota bacterium]|nr:hypothetical protein [Methylomirabilota bacterium]
MKKTLLAIAAICVAVTFQAQAHLIDLGITTGQPANQENRLDRLNEQIDMHNASAGDHTPLPEAVLAGSVKEDINENLDLKEFSLDVSGWDYLVLKWGGMDQHYYVGDVTGDQTFGSTVLNVRGIGLGLSGYSLFNPGTTTRVPDGGISLMLLGAGLGALGLARRFIKR